MRGEIKLDLAADEIDQPGRNIFLRRLRFTFAERLKRGGLDLGQHQVLLRREEEIVINVAKEVVKNERSQFASERGGFIRDFLEGDVVLFLGLDELE